MGYRKKYTRTGETAIPTYQWEDVSDGAGLVSFYCTFGTDNTADTPILSTQQFYSAQIETSTAMTSSSYAEVFNKTFVLGAFNKSQIVKGTAYLSCCTTQDPGDSSVSATHYLVVTIYKNSTSIGTLTTAEQSSVVGVSKTKNWLIPISLTTTNFKVGDQLKVKVEMYGKRTAGGANAIFAIGHDPQNRNGSYLTPSTVTDEYTKMMVHIPFKIER